MRTPGWTSDRMQPWMPSFKSWGFRMDRQGTRVQRPSLVAKAEVSPETKLTASAGGTGRGGRFTEGRRFWKISPR